MSKEYFAYNTLMDAMSELQNATEEEFANVLDKIIDICHECIDMVERS